MKIRREFWIVIGGLLIIFGILQIQSANAAREINAPYVTDDEADAELYRMVELYNGSVVTVGRTLEQRPIYLYLFGSGPVFMFDGRVHGPEDCGTIAGIDFIRWVYEDDGAEAREIREGVTLAFIPSINRDRPTSRLNARGVNLNRNFAPGWGTSGTSYPGEDYRGEAAESEPETRAVMKAITVYDPRIYFNVHCGMEVATGGGDKNTSASMLRAFKDLPHSQTLKYYNPHYSSCGMGGQVKSGACDDNTSAWLYEVSSWGNLPETREAFLEKFRPVYLPIYEAAGIATLKTGIVWEKTERSNENVSIPNNSVSTPPVFNISIPPKTNETINKNVSIDEKPSAQNETRPVFKPKYNELSKNDSKLNLYDKIKIFLKGLFSKVGPDKDGQLTRASVRRVNL